MSEASQYPKAQVLGGAHDSAKHDSAARQITGRATYIDDMVELEGTLHLYAGHASKAHADILEIDLAPARACPGVVDVFTAADLGKHNDISPTGLRDEPVFASGRAEYHGQPIFAVLAKTREAARFAARKGRVTYRELKHVLEADEARSAGYPFVTKPLKLERGDFAAASKKAQHRIQGQMRVGGQDHFYLEGHIALAIPGEDDEITVFSSTQHPSEVQHMVAHVLAVPSHAVTVKVRRMGGGFGGKETQSNFFAVLAALAARKHGVPVKFRPDRDDDMTMTGKRHDFVIDYDLAFDGKGRFEAVSGNFAARCGYSADLSGPITDRTLFHADNGYFYPHVRLTSEPMKTNTVSNTAFRGFGGPQGMMAAERMIEEIAYALGEDTLEIRKRNFYGGEGRDITPYHQKVEDNILHRLVDELEASSDYQARREAILAFNETSPIIKRGIALTPVKFGISFTATWYNQAGALVLIYRDGSVQVNHGGTEMGQGLNTKVAQVLASELMIDLDQIKITATTTDKVPNTSATAASSGSDLNGMAVQDAARKIKARLRAFAAEHFGVGEAEVSFSPGKVHAGKKTLNFPDLIDLAYLNRIQLSDTGFYKTPEIHWDREQGRGKPFYYFGYGAAAAEVSLDSLTGEYQVDRVDILHDVGQSLNPALDKGQIEGGFIQGMGWLTTEELWWDEAGRLRTHAPSTYKIPLASDRPRVFNVGLAEWSVNPAETVRRSKAVGEPPFMLGISVFEAIGMAVASHGGYKIAPRLDAPATPERVLHRLEAIRQEASKS